MSQDLREKRLFTSIVSNGDIDAVNKRILEAGVIRGHRLDLNPAALGLPIAAYIRIRPNPG